jgi:hypothetical protein
LALLVCGFFIGAFFCVLGGAHPLAENSRFEEDSSVRLAFDLVIICVLLECWRFYLPDYYPKAEGFAKEGAGPRRI